MTNLSSFVNAKTVVLGDKPPPAGAHSHPGAVSLGVHPLLVRGVPLRGPALPT